MNTGSVVRVLGASRLAIGTAFLLRPQQLAGPEAGVFITQSFAVREAVLGVGGLTDGKEHPTTWASLGSLIDFGDVVAALLAARRREPAAPTRP
jgi:hypothetical protein